MSQLDSDHTPINPLATIRELERRVSEVERRWVVGTGDVAGATARGDLLAADAGLTWAVLALGGAAGSVLTRGAADPAWSGGYLSFAAGKTLTISNSLTLAGADGKALTLTTDLTNNTGAGVLTWPAGGATLTIPATGTAALGAGTLTAATTNDVTGATHTHAITATAVGAASTIMKTNASGWTELVGLTTGVVVVDRGANLTIAAGAITVTQSYHIIDIEGAADPGTDDLENIYVGGGVVDGMLLFIHPLSNTRDIVLKHATGNLNCDGAADITLATRTNYALLFGDSARGKWAARRWVTI